uniref:BHLH domain-containing protein n=1 Tax=Kalanchoe fedtschenkoi TaxID=63787 RepID=A0A7N0TNV7_KALFE
MADDDRPEPRSFYQLLFSDPIVTLNTSKAAADVTGPDYSESFYGPNPPKMLCFGAYQKEEEAICSEITAAALRQMVSQSDSSSTSSGNRHNSSSGKSSTAEPKPNPNRKRTGSGRNPVGGGASAEGKKTRSEKPAAAAPAHAAKPRPRKEKLGERIATLQQLVSPFGKTDTASVLHEAMSYIKFLHDQVQVLSSPYLHSSPNQGGGDGGAVGLRSRGLCLVPVSCTAQVDGSTNGADFWAPAAGINISSCVNLASSTKL